MTNDLIEKIKNVFSDTQYPGDENIVSHEGQYDDEVKECEQKFLGKKWQEVDWKSISNEGYASGCAFLTDEAYRYYLPAYMLAILEKYDAMANSVDVLVNSLRLPIVEDYTKLSETISKHTSNHNEFIQHQIQKIDEGQKRFYTKMDGFTPEQKNVIAEFLDWLAENHQNDFIDHEPRQANERYWKK